MFVHVHFTDCRMIISLENGEPLAIFIVRPDGLLRDVIYMNPVDMSIICFRRQGDARDHKPSSSSIIGCSSSFESVYGRFPAATSSKGRGIHLVASTTGENTPG